MTRKIFLIITITATLFACQKHNSSGNLLVMGTVRGLRLGTLEIKKMEKDSLVTLDSIKVDGNENFEFHTTIDGAQPMVLELPEVKDGQILFFAAPHDTIHIFTFVESFGLYPIVKGGDNQTEKNAYDKMIKKFNDKEIDLFKAKFEAAKEHLMQKADSLGKKLNNLKQKRKLYTLNFVFRNKDKAIAPYIAMIEFYDNPKALDTIYKILSETIKETMYAKKIKNLLDKQK